MAIIKIFTGCMLATIILLRRSRAIQSKQIITLWSVALISTTRGNNMTIGKVGILL